MILEHLAEQARRAFNLTSFSPEKRGQNLIKEFSAELSEDLEQIKKWAAEYGKESMDVCVKYQSRYEKHFTAWLSSKSNCISPMITGPSNFPTARAQKMNRWEHNKYEFFANWRVRCLQAIQRGFKPKITVDSELDNAKRRLVEREERQQYMKTVNKIIRNAKGNDCTEELIAAGLSADDARRVQTPCPAFKTIGFARFELSNNLASITRLQNRVQELEAKEQIRNKSVTKEQVINGVRVVHNFEADRLQLFFEGRPTAEVITKLKKSGWRWSPSQKCWQRKLTPVAYHSALELLK